MRLSLQDGDELIRADVAFILGSFLVAELTLCRPAGEHLDTGLEHWIGAESQNCVRFVQQNHLKERPDAPIEPGEVIQVGTVLGQVGEHEVRSPFRGVLQSFIAVDTERVTLRQPIAWLRSH